MKSKLLPIDLSENLNKDAIVNRLIEVALYDWVNRSLGITQSNEIQISHFLQAYGLAEDYSQNIAILLLTVESFKPNKLEYALLYNQMGNVPQRDARVAIKSNYINPAAPLFKNHVIKNTMVFPELRSEIKEILLRVTKLSFDYKSLISIEIK